MACQPLGHNAPNFSEPNFLLTVAKTAKLEKPRRSDAHTLPLEDKPWRLREFRDADLDDNQLRVFYDFSADLPDERA